MKLLLIILTAGIVFPVSAQEAVKAKWIRAEFIPGIPEFAVVVRKDLPLLPENAELIYNSARHGAFKGELLYPRVILKDKFVLGTRLSTMDVKTDTKKLEATMAAAYPQHFTESKTDFATTAFFSAVVVAGIHLQFQNRWCFEGLLNYNFTSAGLPAVGFAFKEKESNSFYTEAFYAEKLTGRTLSLECNFLRYSKPEGKLANLFYGFQLTAGTMKLAGNATIDQLTISTVFNTINYQYSARTTCFAAGAFIGFKLVKPKN